MYHSLSQKKLYISRLKSYYLRQYLVFILFLFFVKSGHTQSDTLVYSPDFRFPMNPETKSLFIRDLNHFLSVSTSGDLVKTDLLTMPLTDELNGIRMNRSLKDSLFFKPYLGNLIFLSDTSYLIQLSYIGVNNGITMLRASFELLARRYHDHFIFNSPLESNIKNWKRETIGKTTFVFQNNIDHVKARQFAKLDSLYNAKINEPDQRTLFIQADHFQQALYLAGVTFKSDYAGYPYNSLSDYADKRRVVISGRAGSFPGFDPHDSWHEKLRTVMPDSVINRPVDEGCAYLFGGSWGYSWPQVLDSFMIYVHQNPDADWISLYKNGDKFSMGVYQNPIAYILNALLAESIQQEKEFASVMTLLRCGKQEKGDDNYFTALQKITGITAIKFNDEINRLIQSHLIHSAAN